MEIADYRGIWPFPYGEEAQKPVLRPLHKPWEGTQPTRVQVKLNGMETYP